MSYWDSKNQKIIRFDPIPYPNYPTWLQIDCGCCNGVEWGGEYPKECNLCNGVGVIALHIESEIHAQYPGGPFLP